ncbi:LIM-domain binding protein-domain-containing protein [Tirmania nivea]|nr:LIM-domain binding protein-domain-containing protein [Tirmania nivea]
MATYPPPNVQLQHAVSQAPQQIQAGHPGPTPHAMQHLHPNTHAFQHQQQMQAMANMNNLQQHRFLRQQQQQMLMNGLTANGLSGAGNPGIAPETQRFARAFMPNGIHVGVSGNPQNPGMAGFASANPHIRSQMLHPQMQQQIQAAQQAHIHQQQQQHLVAAQQLALANQGVNVQAAGQNVSMPQQQGTIPANAAAVSGPGQQPNLTATLLRQQAQQQQNKPAWQAVLKMLYFNSQLSVFEKDKQVNNILYWRKFVADFFSPNGFMRQALCHNQTRESKHFEIGNAILPRFFWELIESGVYSVQFQLEGLREKELPGGQGMLVECPRAGLIYRYKDAVCFHHGALKATLNANLQIEMLDFCVTEHQEFVSRSSLLSMPNPNDSPDVKASPHNKQLGRRPLPQGQQASQGIFLPESITNPYGLHPMVFRFLETAETMAYLQGIMNFSQEHPQLTPRAALHSLVEQIQHRQHQIAHQQHQQQMQQAALAAANAQRMQNPQQGHPGGPNAGAGGPQMQNSPHMGMVPGMAGSPAVAEGRLVPPSPHIGQTPSPANQLQAPGQQPQQHPISTSSSQNSTTVGSANTSPNQPNKRRRPSTSQTVKNEVEEGSEPKANNGQNMAVKPSPRMASSKRIKTANPS